MRFGNYHIDSFLEEKQYGQGLSIASMRAYHTAFRHVLDSPLLDVNDPATLTPQNFRRFLYELSERNSWTSHTYNRIRKDLRVFGAFLVREKYLQENPLDSVVRKKEPKELPKSFTSDQLSQILYVLHKVFPGDDYVSARSKAVIYCYLYTGMRLYELINLRLDHVNFREGYIRVQGGKGGKDRLIPILDKLRNILLDFEIKRLENVPDCLTYFPSYLGGKLQHREIYSLLGRIKAKLPFKITTHMFRHTFATELAKKDVNLYNISQIMGHSNINTTKIYLSFQVDAMRTKIDSLDLFS